MSVPSSEPLSSKAKEGGSAKDSPEGKLVASTLGNYSSGAQPPPSCHTLPSWKKDLGAGEKPGQGPRKFCLEFDPACLALDANPH